MPSRRLTLPHYENDRVGNAERVDERDMLFARADLIRTFDEGSPAREEYYGAHPERRELDTFIAESLVLGRMGGDYKLYHDGFFEVCRTIARDESVDGEPAAEKVKLSPEEASRRVKELALALGADLVGTGPLRQEWVYSHVGRSYGNADGFEPWGTPVDLTRHTDAVSMGFRMEPDFTRAAPEFPTILATTSAYAIGALVAVRLAQFIRSLGYSARAHHVFNYRVIAVPVAVDCGLGELSRAGFLITREFGLGVRLGAVTTDLPLAHDDPADIGAQSFCEACEICAEYCPSGAIPTGEKAEHNGIRKWKLEEESCYRYWSAVSTDCSVCMSTCPWTKPPTWLHRALTSAAMIRGPHQQWMVAAEKLFYGAPDKRERGRTVGLESFRPTRLRKHMRTLGAVVTALAAAGLLWGRFGTSLTTPGWFLCLGWLAWTLTGFAAVWTFLAERTIRPAVVAAMVFGGAAAVLLPLVLHCCSN